MLAEPTRLAGVWLGGSSRTTNGEQHGGGQLNQVGVFCTVLAGCTAAGT